MTKNTTAFVLVALLGAQLAHAANTKKVPAKPKASPTPTTVTRKPVDCRKTCEDLKKTGALSPSVSIEQCVAKVCPRAR